MTKKKTYTRRVWVKLDESNRFHSVYVKKGYAPTFKLTVRGPVKARPLIRATITYSV